MPLSITFLIYLIALAAGLLLGLHMVICSPRHLTSWLARGRVAAGTGTHLDLARAVYGMLLDALEKLRLCPTSASDPPLREWYSYLMLHAAYPEGTPKRDIVSRLYVLPGGGAGSVESDRPLAPVAT